MSTEAYERLEAAWAEWNELPPEGMVVCASGTAALHLAFECSTLIRGSSVVTSQFNMIACPRAIAMAGFSPVFVDCDDRLLMQTKNIDLARGVLAAHIYGRRCDMASIADWGVSWIVEDLAEAHGIRPHTSTDAACWSFYRNKIVAGEEGGAVWFRDPERAVHARQLRSLGFTDAHDFNHVPRGHNYRMSNAHATLILQSLARVDESISRRWERIAQIEEQTPSDWRMPSRDVPWVYDLRPGAAKQDLIQELSSRGVQYRLAFKPMGVQKEFRNCRSYGIWNAEKFSEEVIYLCLDY